MSDEPKTGTVDGMLSFADFLIDKNYAPRAVVKPLQTAIERVFSVVYGEHEYRSVDVLKVDMDELMRRFANATGNQYKAESRQTYRARLMRIINIYREHLANPDAPPTIQTRSRGARAATEQTNRNGGSGGSVLQPPRPPSSETRSYSLPLRNGDATLTIPREFYAEDAERLSRLIETLVFEPMRQLPSTSADTEEAPTA
jgi:hypothetical protein